MAESVKPTGVGTLSYLPGSKPGTLPGTFYMIPLFLLTLLVAAVLFPGTMVPMGLIFRVIPGLTVDNAQFPVVAIPLVMVLLNVAALVHILTRRRRGVVLACLSIAVANAALAAAIFFWVPAFKA